MANNFDALTMYVAGRIDEVRHSIGMTQEDLAGRVGVSRASMVNIEAGRQGFPLRRLFDVAAVLECKVSDLLPSEEWYKAHKDKKLKKVVTYEIVD